MKGKKKILGIAVASFALTLGMAFAACGDTEDGGSTPPPQVITLENFDNVSTSLALGDGYELPETVLDTDGNEYEISYAVTTESGKQLGVIDNQVFVNYLETYYVVGTVEVAAGDVRTQTITITVSDQGNPWITFGEIATGQQGVEYTLPEITVHDDSGEAITPDVKLYLLNGDEKGDEVTVEDGVFTPAVGGYYYMEVSAEDSAGNTGSAYEVLYMRANTTGTTQIVTFNDQSEVDANFQFTASADRKSFEKKYIPEFAGEKNVVQVRYTGTYWAARFSIVPMQSVAEDADIFQNYTHVVLRMYTVKSDDCTHYWYDKISMRNADKTKDVASSTIIRQNEWVDYAFPISQLVDFSYYAIDEDGQVTSSSTNASFIGHAESKIATDTSTDAAHKGVYYVAGVYVTNMAEVTTTGDELDEAVTVSATVGGENKDLSNATLRITKPNGSVMKVQGNSFTPTLGGKYEITVLGDDFMGTTSISFMEKLDPAAPIALTKENYATYVTQYQSLGTHSWNATKEMNETGAVQIDWDYTSATGAKYPGFTLTNLWNYDDVKDDYDYALVDVFVVQAGGEEGVTSTIDQYFACSTTGKNLLTTITGKRSAAGLAGYTMTLVLPIEHLSKGSVTIYARTASATTNRGTMRMYVNNIRLLAAALEVTVAEQTYDDGVFELGETFTVTATDVDGNAVDMTTMRTNATRFEGGNALGPNENGTVTITSNEGQYFILVTDKEGNGVMGYAIIEVVAPTTAE